MTKQKETRGLLQVSTYHSERTDMLPVKLGQAIKDSGMFALANDEAILAVYGLVNGGYIIHFGSERSKYDIRSYPKTARDGTIKLLKSELAENSFSFADGAVIGISRLDTVDTVDTVDIQHVATYNPSSIYNSRDLQAMRKDLARDYMLEKDIVFPGTPCDSHYVNYEVVGNNSNPFTGSLNGMNYRVIDVQIESGANYQGLFGVMEAKDVNKVIAQKLKLINFKIIGNAYVGSLASWVKRGTINDVHVEVSSANAGKVEVSGGVVVGINNHAYGGGLVGRVGTGAESTQVRIWSTSSEININSKSEKYSRQIGGLVGEVNKDACVEDSCAMGSVSGCGNDIGGLVGCNNGGTVTGCAIGSVSGSDNVGGLVGYNKGGIVLGYALSIERQVNNTMGSISGFNSVGGLVGLNDNGGTVTGHATRNVIGKRNFAGGLVGLNDNGGTVTGYARGDVTGDTGNIEYTEYRGYKIKSGNSIGGLVGENTGSTVTGHATGSVTGSRERVGSLVGNNYGGTVIGSATGVVTGNGEFVGGLVGQSHGGNVTEFAVDIASATQEMFEGYGFTFGDAIGEWTWIADDKCKWPVINLGKTKEMRVRILSLQCQHLS